MRKEMLKSGGNHVATMYRPQVPYQVEPKVSEEYSIDGVRHYKDSAGGVYNAETFDRIWGKRNSAAMLPKAKRTFQRIRKF